VYEKENERRRGLEEKKKKRREKEEEKRKRRREEKKRIRKRRQTIPQALLAETMALMRGKRKTAKKTEAAVF
jgi:hypothetical protein